MMELFTNPWHRKRRRRRRNPQILGVDAIYALGGVALLGGAYLLFRKKPEDEEPPSEGFAEPPKKFAKPVPTLTPAVDVDYETYPKGISVNLEPRSRDQITVLSNCSVLAVPMPWWEETTPALFEAAWGRGERDPGAIADEIMDLSLTGCPETDATLELRQDVYKRTVREVSARGVPLEAHFEMQEE